MATHNHACFNMSDALDGMTFLVQIYIKGDLDKVVIDADSYE